MSRLGTGSDSSSSIACLLTRECPSGDRPCWFDDRVVEAGEGEGIPGASQDGRPLRGRGEILR